MKIYSAILLIFLSNSNNLTEARRKYVSKGTPGYAKDRYGWSEKGVTSPWGTGNLSENSIKLSSRLTNNSEQQLKDILADEKYTIIDVRNPRYDNLDFDLSDPVNQQMINMNAKFIKMDYDSIRYKPFELIKKIGEVNGYVIPSDDYPEITYGNPTNTIEELRDTPILITCGGQWCGCRFYYASWHGWNDVTVVQSIDDYLPGGHKDLWA